MKVIFSWPSPFPLGVLVFVEVVAAVRRRTTSEELADEVGEQLLRTDTVFFVVLDDRSARDAAGLAAKTGFRGIDALVLQVAQEFGTELISLDEEMLTKVGKVNCSIKK